MRIIVLGNFSGDAAPEGTLAERRPRRVDIDNFEQVIAGLSPQLVLEDAGLSSALRFSTLEDFHPDSLYSDTGLFGQLRDLRSRLRKSDTFAEAAREFDGLVAAPLASPDLSSQPSEELEARVETQEASLERLLGQAVGQQSDERQRTKSALENLMQRAVAENVVNEPDAGRQVYLDAIDQALTDLMRGVLHHPQIPGVGGSLVESTLSHQSRRPRRRPAAVLAGHQQGRDRERR